MAGVLATAERIFAELTGRADYSREASLEALSVVLTAEDQASYIAHLEDFATRDRLTKRLRRAANLIRHVLRALAQDTAFWHDDVWIVDSTRTPLPPARPAQLRTPGLTGGLTPEAPHPPPNGPSATKGRSLLCRRASWLYATYGSAAVIVASALEAPTSPRGMSGGPVMGGPTEIIAAAVLKAGAAKVVSTLCTPPYRWKILRAMISNVPEPHPRIRWIDRLFLFRLLGKEETWYRLLDPTAATARALANDIERAIDIEPPSGERRKLAEDLALAAREQLVPVLDPKTGAALQHALLAEQFAISDGRLTPQTVRAAREQIHLLNLRERNRLLASGHASQLEHTSMDRVLGEYLRAAPWHQKIHDSLHVVLAELERRPALVGESRELGGLDLGATYEVLWSQLRDAADSGVLERLVVQFHQDLARTPGVETQSLRDALRGANQLLQAARQPSFEYCLLLMGSWGSGRSRALASVVSQADKAGGLCLMLDLHAGGVPLADRLVQDAAHVLNVPLRGMGGLNTVLTEDLEATCVVIIDDVDQLHGQKRMLDELRDLVERSTQWPALRWVMTSDEMYFDHVAGGQFAAFWQRYAFLPLPNHAHSIESAGGWIDVDTSNATEELGFSILRRQLPPVLTSELDAVNWQQSMHAHARQLLSNPQQAWIRVDMESVDPSHKICGRLLDLGDLDYLNAYWQLSTQGLQTSLGSLGASEKVLAVIVESLTAASSGHVALSSLEERARQTPHHLDRDTLLQGLEALRQHGTLRIAFEPPPERFALPASFVTPRQDGVWGYLVATQVLTERSFPVADPDAALASLRSWILSSDGSDRFAEAVVRFALQRAGDSELRGDLTFEFGHRLCRGWLVNADLPKEPLFLAATQLPIDRQDALARLLQRRMAIAPRSPSPRELFSLMRFLAAGTSLPVHERLELLQPHYVAIGEAGLGRYLLYVITRLLSTLDEQAAQYLPQLWLSLSGTEAAGIAEEVAEQALDAARQVCQDDNDLHRNMEAYLRWGPQTEAASPAGHREPEANPDGTAPRPFLDHLLGAYCASLTRHRGVDAFGFLADRSWYEPGHHVDRRVALRMRIAANLAMGHWYQLRRMQDPDEDPYLKLIDALISGEERRITQHTLRLEVAFRLIRHTVVTRRVPGVRVRERFAQRLAILHGMPDARAHIRGLEAMYQANLPDSE
ncbi:hypothetical protein ACIBL8_21700 [Streptomyces sp. NPDC050523]|uniref:hypothetical protein n=1 Tax=Streptomyces sp. NPDC050523 TaxID=3365622 RepID=UPI00379B555F